MGRIGWMVLATALCVGCDDGDEVGLDSSAVDAGSSDVAGDRGTSPDAAPDARADVPTADMGAADGTRDAESRPPDAAESVDAGAAQDAAADAAEARDGAPDLDATALEDAAPVADAAPIVDASEPDAEPDAALPRCAPVECAEVSGQIAEHTMAAVDPCAFALRLEAPVAPARALADALAEAADGYVDFLDVNLNRQTQAGVTAGAADRLRNHDFVGFRWNAGDQATASWYPQGITGHSDAGAGDDRWLIVSWYDNLDDAFEKGVRVSLVNPAHTDYRHLLLVQPVADGDGVNFTAALYDNGGSLHAGGIVWFGDLLYVADTTVGVRVFDLSRVMVVPDTSDTDLIGVRADRVDAHGYRYMVPQIARFALAPHSCPIRFSYIGLDRSGAVPALVTGEYRRDDHNGRMARWPLDPETGWLSADANGDVYATEAVIAGQNRMQGGMTWRGDYYISSSSQVGANLGRLYRNRPAEESRITAWPYGCEDLYYERAEDLVWTPTEHPNAREVVGIPLVRP